MISTMSRISIIIPAFNQARFLGQAIESALGQAGAEVEVIVVDDGSTDDTPSVIARYQTAPGFKSIRQPNAGLPAARNRGLAEATGEYLCFLDSDDYFAPEKCNRQAALLEAKPQLGFVYCDITTVDETGAPKPDQISIGQVQRTLTGDIFPALIVGGYFPPHTVMIRKKVLDVVGPFDPALGGHADYDLWLRVAAEFQAEYMDEKLAFYRDWGASMSKNREHMNETRVRTLQKIARLHPELAGIGLHQLQADSEKLFLANQRLNGELIQALVRSTPLSAQNDRDQVYSLLVNLAAARLMQGQKDQSAIWDVVLEGQPTKALLLQPPIEMVFDIPTGAAGVFATHIAMHPDVWLKEDSGPCEFQVQIDRRLALAAVLDPTHLATDRHWHGINLEVPASPRGNHQISIRTRSPNGANMFRWALWRNPRFAWQSIAGAEAPAAA
jgi:glycosyltransferase involved in cell wall biosynthesis